MILPEEFYTRSDVLRIAGDLLGKKLITEIDGKRTSGIIVETEAYRAPEDRASHAYDNKLTDRTKTMFASGGVAYVYICYGIHHLFNVVTGEEGIPHAVLIRAVEPIEGLEIMKQRRRISTGRYRLTNGPGKLAVAMGILRNHDCSILYNEKSPVRIEEGREVRPDEIIMGPRVGVGSAGQCALRPWRYRIRGNAWTSKPDVVTYQVE